MGDVAEEEEEVGQWLQLIKWLHLGVGERPAVLTEHREPVRSVQSGFCLLDSASA